MEIPSAELKALKKTTKELLLQVKGFQKRLGPLNQYNLNLLTNAQLLQARLEQFFEDVRALEPRETPAS